MSDLISREAILKHIEKIRQSVQMMDDTHRASIIMNGMYLCEKAVRNQPSAQSDIVHCRECIHWRYDTDHTCRYYGGASPRLAIDFCSKGERRAEDD